jgi:hypothetical protein
MIEYQGIDITEASMTTAKQQVYEDIIQEMKFEVRMGCLKSKP